VAMRALKSAEESTPAARLALRAISS
jgi:hypothetical protein